MKYMRTSELLPFILLIVICVSCNSGPSSEEKPDTVDQEAATATPDPIEEEVRAAVERLFMATGNYNIANVRSILSEHGQIGITSKKDGIWSTREITFKDFLQGFELEPYCEVVNEYDIITTDGRMALVRADAVVNSFGMPGKREVNNMLFLKEGENWKLQSIAWTVHDLPEEKREFDLNNFARGYAQAWSS
jgi:hypothetical protein